MSRPTALVGIVFEERLDFGVVEFVGGHDAVFVVDLEENNRHHQGAARFQAWFCASERSCDIEGLRPWAGPIPALVPVGSGARPQSPRRRSRSGRTLA